MKRKEDMQAIVEEISRSPAIIYAAVSTLYTLNEILNAPERGLMSGMFNAYCKEYDIEVNEVFSE